MYNSIEENPLVNLRKRRFAFNPVTPEATSASGPDVAYTPPQMPQFMNFQPVTAESNSNGTGAALGSLVGMAGLRFLPRPKPTGTAKLFGAEGWDNESLLAFRRGGRFPAYTPFLVGEEAPELQLDDDGRVQIVGAQGAEVRSSDTPGQIVPLDGQKRMLALAMARLAEQEASSGAQPAPAENVQNPIAGVATTGNVTPQINPLVRRPQIVAPAAMQQDGQQQQLPQPNDPLLRGEMPAPTPATPQRVVMSAAWPPYLKPKMRNTGDRVADLEDYESQLHEAPTEKMGTLRRIAIGAGFGAANYMAGGHPAQGFQTAMQAINLHDPEAKRKAEIADVGKQLEREDVRQDKDVMRRYRLAQIEQLPDKNKLQRRAQLLRQLQGKPKYVPGEDPAFDAQLQEAEIHADAFDKSKGTNLQKVWVRGTLHTFNPRSGSLAPVVGADGQVVTDPSLVPVEEGGLWVKPGAALRARTGGVKEAEGYSVDTEEADYYDEQARLADARANEIDRPTVGLAGTQSGMTQEEYDEVQRLRKEAKEYREKARLKRIRRGSAPASVNQDPLGLFK